MPRTVVIVDDYARFRSLARRLLEKRGYAVVGEAADGAEAIAMVERLHPHVVLLDIQLPDIDGFEVARRLAQSARASAVVMISTREESAYRDRLARSSARGFIYKGELNGERLDSLLADVA